MIIEAYCKSQKWSIRCIVTSSKEMLQPDWLKSNHMTRNINKYYLLQTVTHHYRSKVRFVRLKSSINEQVVWSVVRPPQYASASCKWWLEQPPKATWWPLTFWLMLNVSRYTYNIPANFGASVTFLCRNFVLWPLRSPRKARMSVMLVNVYFSRKLSLKFIVLPVPKIWLIFGHGVN